MKEKLDLLNIWLLILSFIGIIGFSIPTSNTYSLICSICCYIFGFNLLLLIIRLLIQKIRSKISGPFYATLVCPRCHIKDKIRLHSDMGVGWQTKYKCPLCNGRMREI